VIEVAFRYMPKQARNVSGDSGVASARQANPNWSKAFEKLRYELSRIDAKDVVIEAGYKPHQVRADGWPYSNASPEHHQVRVSFRKGTLPMSFFQGAFGGSNDCVPYNVWLIASTLTALRAVERYGCAQGGEQYRGWAQLPPGSGSAPIAAAEWPSVEAAMRFLSGVGDGQVVSVLPADVDIVYRAAARKAHPDKGGSAELMAKVNRARDYISGGMK